MIQGNINRIHLGKGHDFTQALAHVAESAWPTLILPDEALEISEETIIEILHEFDKDPMLGFLSICGKHLGPHSNLPLPRSYCLLIRPELIDEFLQTASAGLDEPQEIILTLVLLANQVGYGVKTLPLLSDDTLSDPLENSELLSRLCQRFPGLETALFEKGPSTRRSHSGQPRVIFDFLNTFPVFNGTTEVALQLLHSIILTDTFEVSVLAEPKTLEFFEIAKQFPRAKIYDSVRQAESADVAVSLCQPNSFAQLAQIEALAPRRAFIIHDCIAYDCLAIREQIPGIEAVFRKIAETADLIIFPSEFSRKIFRQRFSNPSATNLLVNHLSLSPDDYLSPWLGDRLGVEHPILENTAQESQTIVLGNQFYSHKGIEPCIQLLGEVFPEKQFSVLGLLKSKWKNIHPIPSGRLSWNAIDRLIRKADTVIIPSFYEGFGLPLFHALSRNKTVFVRDSELVRELVPLWKGPGRVISYRSTRQLGEKLTGYYARSPLEDNSRTRLRNDCRSWKNVGEDLCRNLSLLAQMPASALSSGNYLSSYALSQESQVLDSHLRRSIIDRESLRAQIIDLDENLQIALSQRDTAESFAAKQAQLLRLEGLRSSPQNTNVLKHFVERIMWPPRRASVRQQSRFLPLLHFSRLFDDGYYLRHNRDVLEMGLDPLLHYLLHGAREGRNPNPLFDSCYYLENNRDVSRSGANPLVHFLLFGASEHRDPHRYFDTRFYLRTNPDVAASAMNPLAHFLAAGCSEGREAHPQFALEHIRQILTSSTQ